MGEERQRVRRESYRERNREAREEHTATHTQHTDTDTDTNTSKDEAMYERRLRSRRYVIPSLTASKLLGQCHASCGEKQD